MPDGLTSRIEGLLPAATIASDIDVHPFDGLTGFVHHNGIDFKRRVDPAGRTTQLSAASATAAVSRWAYTYGTGPRIRSIEQHVPAIFVVVAVGSMFWGFVHECGCNYTGRGFESLPPRGGSSVG